VDEKQRKEFERFLKYKSYQKDYDKARVRAGRIIRKRHWKEYKYILNKILGNSLKGRLSNKENSENKENSNDSN
jgi:hypothetical protein